MANNNEPKNWTNTLGALVPGELHPYFGGGNTTVRSARINQVRVRVNSNPALGPVLRSINLSINEKVSCDAPRGGGGPGGGAGAGESLPEEDGVVEGSRKIYLGRRNGGRVVTRAIQGGAPLVKHVLGVNKRTGVGAEPGRGRA